MNNLLYITIAEIRALTGTLPEDFFYVTDKDMEGVWYYDSVGIEPDNTGTVLNDLDGRVYKRVIEGNYIYIKWFGAKGDGVTNDMIAFEEAVAVATTNNYVLKVNNGNYKLTVSAPVIINNTLRLIGENRNHVLINGHASVSTLFTAATGASVTFQGITFTGWNYVITSNQHLTELNVVECSFQNNREHAIYFMDVSDNPHSAIDRIYIANNYIYNAPGFKIRSAVGSAIITANVFEQVQRDPEIYSSTYQYSLFAINIGDSDDVDPDLAQNDTTDIVVTNNLIEGIKNYSNNLLIPSFATTNAIAIHGRRAIVSNNIIKGLETLMQADGEAIYFKVSEGIISGNEIINGSCRSADSAAIAIKGVQENGNAPRAYRVKVTNNIIYENRLKSSDPDAQFGSVGITTFGGADFDISGNSIEGLNYCAIMVVPNTYKQKVRNYLINNNHIINCHGNKGIFVVVQQMESVTVLNNIFKNIEGNDNTTYFSVIELKAFNDDVVHGTIENILVKNNVINLPILDQAKSNVITLINVVAATSISNATISGNMINIGAITVTSPPVNMWGITLNAPLANNINLTGNSFDGQLTSLRFFGLNNIIEGLWNGMSLSWLTALYFDKNSYNCFDSSDAYVRWSDTSYAIGSVERIIMLMDLTANAANQVVSLPDPATFKNRQITLQNRNTSAYTWSFNSAVPIRFPNNSVTTVFPNSTVYTLLSNGGYWLVIN